MKSNYKALSELVERVDIRNSDGGIDELIGVSIEKCFIKSVANTIGTDLTKYKIIKKNEFAVSLMQVSRDAKIPIACLKDYEIAIMSPAYSIFRVKNEQEVLPGYLDLWFRRSEFDREAAFIAVGGVRGSMPWDEFTRMEVFIPEYEEQRRIVNSYKAISDRIALKRQINDNLSAMAEAIYIEWFVNHTPFIVDGVLPSTWVSGTVGDVITLQRGHDLPKTQMVTGKYPVMGSTGVIAYHNQFTTKAPVIAMGRSGNIGNPRYYNFDCWAHNTCLYVKEFRSFPLWAFFLLKHINYDSFVGGSAVPTLNRNNVHALEIVIPPRDVQADFTHKVKGAVDNIESNLQEIAQLEEMQKILLSRMVSNQ